MAKNDKSSLTRSYVDKLVIPTFEHEDARHAYCPLNNLMATNKQAYEENFALL